MIRRCEICGNEFKTRYRGWYDKYIPLACSSQCLVTLILSAEELHPEALDGVTPFKSPINVRLMRSGYEREFREWLNPKVPWEYEPYTFTFANKKRYVPDFFIARRVFAEVKGKWTSEAKMKIQRLSSEFFDIPIMVVDRAFLDMLRRTDA